MQMIPCGGGVCQNTGVGRLADWDFDVVGGAGIVCGLAIFGYKIMRVLGVRTVKLSNSRGFCAELSTAIVVLVASRYGLPVSTTQVITGALLTLGLFEGWKGVNWRVLIKVHSTAFCYQIDVNWFGGLSHSLLADCWRMGLDAHRGSPGVCGIDILCTVCAQQNGGTGSRVRISTHQFMTLSGSYWDLCPHPWTPEETQCLKSFCLHRRHVLSVQGPDLWLNALRTL